ncbi:MAG: hypothetical protein K1W30_21700 [Lachnospiraceae bacterium]
MINREYKDRLFSFIFGSPERKDWTLSLYNAVNGSSYTNPEDIKIITIDDVLYMSMKNDLALLVTDIANMYEQQSTYNPNMPVRKLMYAARLYDKYIHINKLNIYSTKQIRLPVPKLVTFYNGKEDKEDSILELKDAFKTEDGQPIDAESDIQIRVRMININYGKNKELMCACKPLEEYAWFIEEIRKNNGSMEIEAAVDNALDAMPEDFALKQLLIANKAEVRQMCITEYNEAETMAQFKEEGREEGKEENALTMLRDNLALDKVALYSGVPMFRILELQKTLH